MIDFSTIKAYWSDLDKTKTGRVLTYVNLALSLMFAIWAAAVYSNEVDWTDRKSQGEEGVYARLNDAIKQLDSSRGPAEGRLLAGRSAVAKWEAARPEMQARYARELQSLRSGDGSVQAPTYVKDELQLDNQGHPRLGPVLGPGDKPLRGLASIAKLDQAYKQRLDEIQNVTTALDGLVADQQKSSTEIGNGQEQGLRFDLAGVEKKIKQSQERQEVLKPQVYNRQVELALLLKRQKSLQSRLKELQGTSVTE